MITGSQARDLLEGSSEGPWEASSSEATMNDQSQWRIGKHHALQVARSVMRGVDARLMAAAPDLAETVAWLYGREADGYGKGVHRGRMSEYDQEAVAAHPQSGVVEVYAAQDRGDASAMLSPDEAVDLARALLAAAQEARR